MKVDIETVEYLPMPPNFSDGRSPGLHVSNIIRCIGVEAGILTNEWAEELSLVEVKDINKLDIIAQIRIHMGIAWEEHYLRLLPEVEKHPGEMHLDGVYLSHDGQSLSVIFTLPPTGRYGILIHEVKCTYKSTKTVGPTPEDFISNQNKSNLLWLLQIRAYCKAKGTRHAVLHVLFVCGDYKFPIRPIIYRYHLEFTQEELDNNWDLLMDYKNLKLEEN